MSTYIQKCLAANPLVQGRSEIPVVGSVLLPQACTENNAEGLARYQTLIGKLFQKKVNGKFGDKTASVLAESSSSDSEEEEEESEGEPGDFLTRLYT